MFSSQNLTVLYIEHDTQVRNEIAQFMRENGLNVLEADNTESASNLFRTHHVDIVIVDLQLSGSTGLEFIRYLRHKHLYTPAIITTSHTDKDILLAVINLEITRYLTKPIQKPQLLDALKVATGKLHHTRLVNFTPLHDGFSYDPINKSVNTPEGQAVQLSKKESLLLELLLSNKRQLIPYDTIERTLWQDSSMSMDALRTLVRGIRKKTYPNIISNHNAIGYKIDL